YEVGSLISEHSGLARYRGRDLGDGQAQPADIVILRAALPLGSEHAVAMFGEEIIEAEVLATDEAPSPEPQETAEENEAAAWPGLTWEQTVLERAASPALPRVLGRFSEGGYDFLIEEVPAGFGLWDALDDPAATNLQRYTWLRQIGETLQLLHRGGAILEAFRPEFFVVTPEGQARFTSLAGLLPLPLPSNPPLQGSLYAAPELLLSSDKADARANLY